MTLASLGNCLERSENGLFNEAQTAVILICFPPMPNERSRRWTRVRQIKDDQDDIIFDFIPRGVAITQTCQCPIEPRQDDDKEPDEETKTEALHPAKKVAVEGLLPS